jgi:hypothetical protein
MKLDVILLGDRNNHIFNLNVSISVVQQEFQAKIITFILSIAYFKQCYELLQTKEYILIAFLQISLQLISCDYSMYDIKNWSRKELTSFYYKH